jgi:hypothetical protein
MRCLGLAAFLLLACVAPAAADMTRLDDPDGGKAALAAFDAAPFPYDGMVPADDTDAGGDDVPFLDVHQGGRRGHTSARGGVYWRDETYSDRRSLLYIPPGFDPRKKAVILVFFHGNQATLQRDVIARQQVTHQLAVSGLNAVLVAPQLAVDALDSSAGGFWRDGQFARYLREAASHLAGLQGDGAKPADFAKLPVVIVAYSGGYLPAVWSAAVGGAGKRLKGIILMDALYDETDRFADWIADHQDSAFFLSAFGVSAAPANGTLQDALMNQGIAFDSDAPRCLKPGRIVFLDAGPGPQHQDFLTAAWTANPLTWLFDRIGGYPRDAKKLVCKK